mmetsp:Transcript_53332/g.141377  ORF Transcript_53332/g.141377 Transcript_53332/m.141377 type:complete len:212 (-) Transcript_53332:281-916(-)
MRKKPWMRQSKQPTTPSTPTAITSTIARTTGIPQRAASRRHAMTGPHSTPWHSLRMLPRHTPWPRSSHCRPSSPRTTCSCRLHRAPPACRRFRPAARRRATSSPACRPTCAAPLRPRGPPPARAARTSGWRSSAPARSLRPAPSARSPRPCCSGRRRSPLQPKFSGGTSHLRCKLGTQSPNPVHTELSQWRWKPREVVLREPCARSAEIHV